MYKKIEDNKILKIKNDKITKIILSIEPFSIKEMQLNDLENNNFNNKDKNKEYHIEKLLPISKEEIILSFKSYIKSSYDTIIQKRKKLVEEKKNELLKLLNLDVEFDDYAYGNITYDRKSYAVLKDNKWYDYNSLQELSGIYKEGIVESEFIRCTKEEFLTTYIEEGIIPLQERINSLEKNILNMEKSKIKLLTINFDFILGD